MTAQIGEILIYKGKRYRMATEPLKPYIKKNNIKFNTECIATCWRRCYIGTWSIENDRLYLIGLDTYDNGKKVGLEYLFPEHKKIFANWFSGELRIPYGKVIEYINPSFAPLLEKELFLKIKKGIVTNEREIDNTRRNDFKSMNKVNKKDLIKTLFGDNKRARTETFTSKILHWITSLLK